MAVVTFSRKLGSQGDAIAKQVAQALDYHFVDKDFIGTVLSQYGLIEFDTEYDNLPSFWEKFNAQKMERRELMVGMLNRVIQAVAYHNNVVILGRSGYVVLRGFSDVLNVRVQAPYHFRVQQIMKSQQISKEQAEELVKQGDHVRATFVKSFYGVQWDLPCDFDLLMDTSKIAPELAVAWLVEATKALDKREADEHNTTRSLDVDAVLAAAISDEMNCKQVHRS